MREGKLSPFSSHWRSINRENCLAEVFVVYPGKMVLIQREETSFRWPQPRETAKPPSRSGHWETHLESVGSCWKVMGGIGVAWKGSSIKV